jgi:hypothetical protein
VIVDNSTKINKAKENSNSDSQQYRQYQQSKTKEILNSDGQLSTITVENFFYFVDLGGIVDYHYINFLLFC